MSGRQEQNPVGCQILKKTKFPSTRNDLIIRLSTMASQSAIIWPKKYLPGYTDNYVSNEVIVADLSASDIWPLLSNITRWETYYDNCSQITPPKSGTELRKDEKFGFSTFGFPPLTCECTESVAPKGVGKPGRIAWQAELKEAGFDCYHAWIVEDLDYGDGKGAVRILTQETQRGEPAKDIAGSKPNKMLNGHQAWLDGLVKAAREAKSGA